MDEITLKELKIRMLKYEDRDVSVDIYTFVKTMVMVKKSKIFINNMRIIISNGKCQDLEIDLESLAKIEVSKAGNVFKLYFDSLNIGDKVIINFDKLS